MDKHFFNLQENQTGCGINDGTSDVNSPPWGRWILFTGFTESCFLCASTRSEHHYRRGFPHDADFCPSNKSEDKQLWKLKMRAACSLRPVISALRAGKFTATAPGALLQSRCRLLGDLDQPGILREQRDSILKWSKSMNNSPAEPRPSSSSGSETTTSVCWKDVWLFHGFRK